MKKPKKVKKKQMVFNPKINKGRKYNNNFQSVIDQGALCGKGWWTSIADEY